MNPQHLATIRRAISIMLRDSPNELAIIDQLQAIVNQSMTKPSFRQTTDNEYKANKYRDARLKKFGI